ncbi:nitroreductase family protein [Candidatus Enterococcus mansonii]|uniref:Nitroreductase domain-containing protein n=1 Tax=Candidatus Enterococcus mansonii TaxID=1834181 RepID=A0A242CCZ6_9ENTE|nr:nitroreductase family protein [Enterococcus sp. 4G2_DIV0659]OTO08117.1 hypothetical protein A5880_002387 [Enterococcus sp. 4G2_DIV0659]
MDRESIQQTIRERRTIRTLSDQEISIDIINELLESASYAPYHSKNEPWEVIIVKTLQDRQLFVEKIMESYDRLNSWARYDQQNQGSARKKTQDYFLNVPLTLIVTAPINESPKKNLEAIGAVSAFIQNFQLVAWSKQIGVTWRTIPVIFDEAFKQEIGVVADRQIIGLLSVNRIDEPIKLPTSYRKPVTHWSAHLSEKLKGMSESDEIS